jgi:predicted glycogen debranching enzyme
MAMHWRGRAGSPRGWTTTRSPMAFTWMDAKVGDWVVTPRRGKAIEINALWYNALRLIAEWLDIIGDPNSDHSEDRFRFAAQADLAYASFQKRFWNPALDCLYDVVDSPEERDGQLIDSRNDPSVRPNQVIALALKYPVLAKEKWKAVLEIVKKELWTPVGLRSLSPRDRNYKEKYDGDLRTRDAAYHQGTVWAWLIGPFFRRVAKSLSRRYGVPQIVPQRFRRTPQ